MIYALTIPSRDAWPVKEGVLDLTHMDFHEQGLVNLDGEWEFYPNQLLQPEDFRQGEHGNFKYLRVPGTWKGLDSSGGVSRKGFGTYRLRIFVNDPEATYGLKLNSIRMGHQLYINGKKEGNSGRPAAAKEEGYIPANTPYAVYFHPNGQEIELVLQVSNYVYFTGGIVNPIQFGKQSSITQWNGLLFGSDLALVVTLFMFSTYHLNLYFLRRRERTYLFSGLYFLSLSIMHVLYGEKIFQQLWPEAPFYVVYKTLDVAQFSSAIFIVLFFCSIYKGVLTDRIKWYLLVPHMVYVISIFILPYSIYNEVRFIFFSYLGLVTFYIMARMFYLFSISRRAEYERKEQLLFIVAFISLTLYLVDGSLFSESIIQTNMRGKIALTCYVMSLNMLLAYRFTNAYKKNEMLTDRLTVSDQLKDQFLMHTSHEIKTPLHGIMNITSYLLDDDERNLSLKQRQHLWLIKDTSVKLSMLMQDLIDVSRLKHGELRLNMMEVEVRSIVQIVFNVLRFELTGKAVRLNNRVPADQWVQADENRLRQILYNLVHNAIKNTDEGEISVALKNNDGIAYITVKDTGRGMDEGKQTKVFHYFEQSEEVLPDDGYTGMGVGLYISRKLAERMDGQLRIGWSEVGKGTSMLLSLRSAVKLPLERQQPHARELERTEEIELEANHIMEQYEYTILIVDDEASNIHTLLNILKRHRYNVIAAFSAHEAMDKIKQYPQVDLVILDVMMPGTSGIELCEKLRAQYSILDLPILFATAKDTSHDIAMGFGAGANDYLTKPFEAETLIARIQTLLTMKTSIQDALRNQMAFHQAQIKPHFLYNALSSVISFCYTDGEKAAFLLSKLSQYLRYILDTDHQKLFVTLNQELELIEAYVEIERARFGERFDFVCYADEHLRQVTIPSLCIQPFVENAIRHGLFEKDGHGTVILTIREADDALLITVKDDGVGIPKELIDQFAIGLKAGKGIGMTNIRARLDAIPGASLSISSTLGRGTKITMCLPRGQHVLQERRREIV
ncbi:histidine kinase [Paenibacillus rigui]|uniref:histidine kinase n=2 Tax=Paenibacillus rigui TaxID=554312 RepID=A0A229UNQ1_9BACL|nr:histidine kinase [Paenibacillus rigui]